MNTKFLIFLFFSLSGSLLAQQEAQYTQYMYNTIVFNSAYAGNRDATNIFGLHRSQWTGFDGAPQTNNFSIDTRLSENVGIGLTFVQDKIGPSKESDIAMDFSYGFQISPMYRLSFGIKASAHLLNVDFSISHAHDDNDYSFDTNIENQFSPNVGVGIYFNSDNSYIGLSVPNLIKSTHFNKYGGSDSTTRIIDKEINLYLLAGHVFDLNDMLKFKPSLLTKLVVGAPVAVDLSANFLMSEKFTAGASYGLNSSANLLAGFKISNNWFVGYSYGIETTKLYNYNSGSHEIFLNYTLFHSGNMSVVAPRFF